MNLKFKYVIVLTERNVCAKNHAETLLETMFGQIGRFFSDKAICNIIGQNKKMANIWGETNFACMNLKFKYVIVLTEGMCAQKITLKYCWKECLAK